MSITATPIAYKNINLNNEYSISGAKLPICSWNSDVYINWLTQNAVSIGISTFAPLLNQKQNPVSISLNTANNINSILQAEMIPNQAKGNTNCGDVNFSKGYSGFTLYYTTIKDDYAKIIDNYFTRFGYAIKSLKIPNITGRKYWNYVEIGNTEEIGNGEVPSSYMENINNACRKGVTIWHNHANIGNFSLNNEII